MSDTTNQNPEQIDNGTPAVTPPAAPVVPPAEPAVPQIPEAKSEPEPKVAVFDETGDPALDIALGYAAQQGLTPDSPEIQAAREGDFKQLEAYFRAKAAPGWEKQLALAKGAYERVVNDAKARTAALEKTIYDIAGGKEQWAKAAEFVGKIAPDAQKQQINAALQEGGLVAEAMAAYVIQTYKAQNGKAARQPGSNAAPAAATDAPLSARDYGRAVEELTRKSRGKDVTQTPEYKALVERRLAARRAGIN